jgi:hypothetical protein
LAPGIYNFYESVGCCDTGSTSNVAILSGSRWYNPGGTQGGNVIGMVYYNPTTARCEQISVSSSVSVPSFVITLANQDTYTYGSGSEQCNRCAILAPSICSGSICYSYSFQNTNSTTIRVVDFVTCDGVKSKAYIDPLATLYTCSYATPLAEVPAQTVITNLGVCGGTTTTTAGPSSTYRAISCCDSQSYYIDWLPAISPGTGSAINVTIYNPNVGECMKIVENVVTQSATFTITNANYNTYAYGYDAYPNEQCINCTGFNPC